MNTQKVLQKFWALSLVILLAGFIGIGQTSAQTNYFVDTVAGNDTFNGSQMAVGGFPNGPFKTIAAATAVAVDGDTVTILANSYAEAISTTAAVTYEVQTSGGNTVVTITSITHNSAADTATYTDAAGGGVGTFALTGGITLTAGTVNFGTAVVVATGQTITRTLGALTGTAPTTTNVNVTYNGALTAGMTAGNELPASLGSGKLTLSHTGDLLTIPNAVSVNDVQSTTTGDVTFASTLTTTAGGATDVNIDVNNNFTVSGSATIAGGIDIDAAATIGMGATSMGALLDNDGGNATFASVDLNGQNLLNTSGTIAVTGDLTVGVAATGTRVTVTAGTVTVGTLTADPLVDTVLANEADVVYTINNDATFTVNGAITESSLAVVNGVNTETETGFEYAVFTIDNADGQEFSIGASSTIRGDVNNAERDAGGDGDGIILNNSATLTLQGDDDAIATLTSIGDIVGGTLVLNYANGNTDSGDATNNQSVTLVNNLTYGANTATLASPAADLDNSIAVSGNLSLGASVTFPYNFTVGGTVSLAVDNVVIDGHAAGPAAAGNVGQSYGGFNAGAFTATFGTGGGNEAITITGTQADFNDSTVNGIVTANTVGTGPGALTASAGASFDGVTVGSVVLSGTGQVDIDGPLDVGGSVTIPAGLILDQTALGGASDIDGNLDVNGSFDIAGGGTLTIDGDVDIDATTGDITTAVATTFNLNGNFTGGSYPGVADTWVVNTASGGTTIAVKPGTTLALLTVNGSGLTSTFTESVTVSGGITVGNDAIVALGANNFVLTGGDLTLTDEASITNDGVNGSVQFTATGAVTQNIIVGGTPTTNPTLQNVVMNMTNAAGILDMDQAINISGTFTALDGQLTDANLITFTGANGELAIAPAAASVTGATNGVHDLEYLGAVATGGAEYTATGIRNLTINMTAAVLTLPATDATISGNVVVNAGSGLTTQESMAVQGNATFNGNVIADQNEILNISGNLTVADGISITGSGADATVELSGASSTHSIIGVLGADTILDISGTGITVNGSIAGGDVNADSEFQAITVDATGSATFTSVQDINGNVTVDGTAVITLVSDGGTVTDTDGQVTGNVLVNGGGSLTLASNDATVTAIGGTLVVDDNGSFILGSSLGSTGDVTVGDGSDATEATFNLNGNTFIPGGAALAITVVASGAPATAPTFGTSGTLNIPNGGEIVGATNPTIPNLIINGGVAIDSDVTVSGTFTVAAASSGEDGDDVTVAGTAQINANYTGTAGPTGSQLDITGQVLNTTAAAVTITNLGIASTGSTLASRTGASTVFTVSYLDHDSGKLDISEETFTLTGVAAIDDWDHDGGTYAGTGTYVMTGAADEIDLSTNGATISVPNLTVNGVAGGGLQLDAAADGITVTGTLTLNDAGGNVETEVGASDATFSMGNGSTIVRSTGGAVDHFDNAPTLGTGMTVRYTHTLADVTTANELPTTLARIEYESDGTVGDDLILEDGVAVIVDQIESSGDINIDLNDDGDNTITITDGGRIEYDGAAADFTFDTPVVAGAITYRWDATDLMTDLLWPDAQTGATVSVTDGTVTLHEDRTAGVLVAGDGTGVGGSAELALGANTLTVSGTTTIDSDGAVTGAGTLNTDGVVTNSGTLSSAVVASQNLALTGNIASLTLDGTTAQTVTVPAGGATFATALVVNNTAGATFAGMTSGSAILVGAQTVAAGAVNGVTAGLTLTEGVLTVPDGNSLILPHGGSGLQGYTRTNGCVFGNVRKQLSNTTSTAPADRLDFPLCSAGGLYRPYALTFNNPNTIGGVAPTVAPATTDASPAITVRHDVSGENSVAELSGTNGLAQTVNGVMIARYPQAPSFFWTVSPSFTMSPSLSYDVDMRANDYANFSSSCGASACDINEIYPVRRHVGSTSNLWSVASSTTDNFLAGADDPVVVGRSATGALQSSGTVFTYGLKSIFAAATSPAAITVSTGNAHVVDLSTYFTGYTGSLTYNTVTSSNTAAANPVIGDLAGNNMTVTGGATAAATTITVSATDSFGGTASVAFVATNSQALAVTATDHSTSLNVGGTDAVTYASAFTGGTAVVTYAAASDNAAVTVLSDGTTVTATAASAGSATITLTATDASSTPVVVTKTYTVTVANVVSVAAGIADQTLLQGASAVIDASGVFTGGTGATTITVSGTDATASATVSGTDVTITGLAAYVGTPLADSTPATITLTGTDTLGGTTTDTFTVTVNPVQGSLSGGAAPTAFDASLILNEFLGLSSPALTAKQLAAADYDSDGDVDPFDAFQAWQASAPKRGEVDALASAGVGFGEMTQNGTMISIPVIVTGSLDDAAAVSFSTLIDPALATIANVTSDLGDDWMFVSNVTEDGEVKFAAIGASVLPSDGVVATINLTVQDGFAAFSINGEGAVNNNTISSIDAVDVIEIPDAFALEGNYPNPFNPSTTIQFDLPETADVEVHVFDMIGRQVMALPSQTIQAGAKRSLQMNASQLASGSYFYRVVAKMQNNVAVETGRMTLIK
ncbi:MAG: T9SS type A sorting domain-containing protein [Bacteroidetes Order II. Incertae sedis bacterium]|nr:T9SS type A sorting domain-containing protein [Bacteroidetes Order II. bacterium]